MLRPYQERLAADTVAAVKAGENPIMVLPTGGGKTITAAEVVRRLGRSTLWLAHRQELVMQAARSLRDFQPSIIMAGIPQSPPIFGQTPVYVGSLDTVMRRPLPDISLVVADECHHCSSDGYSKLLKRLGCPMIGLTATPFRLDGKGLGPAGFTKSLVGAYTDELVKQGWLHAPKVYAGASPDMRGVAVRMGDYNLTGSAKRMSKLTGDIVKTWKEKTPGKRTICFAVNVQHSLSLVEAFRDNGVRAAHVDGKTPKDERLAIFRDLMAGDLDIVSNCMVATEGTDLPAVEVAIIARPTASLNLHLQMIGRIMRICDGKDGAIVLDHAGNHHVHGMVTRRIEDSLDGKIAGESEPLGLRRCQACGLFYEPSEDCCPECGYKPAPPERWDAEIAGPGELTEFVEDFAYKSEFWRLIEAQRMACGYKPGWSAFRYKERFGEWPTIVDGELVDTSKASMNEKREVYRRLLKTARTRGFKDGWASWKYRETFGCWPSGFVASVKAEEKWSRLVIPPCPTSK